MPRMKYKIENRISGLVVVCGYVFAYNLEHFNFVLGVRVPKPYCFTVIRLDKDLTTLHYLSCIF